VGLCPCRAAPKYDCGIIKAWGYELICLSACRASILDDDQLYVYGAQRDGNRILASACGPVGGR